MMLPFLGLYLYDLMILTKRIVPKSYVLGSKLPLFSYGRDGHQPYSRGLYTHYKDSLLKVG